MDALQARINSFKKSKRVKNSSKPSSTTTLKWPHPPEFRANPESLAEAGFYYDPSYDDPDNVTCYVCEKELGGWEEDDDPFLIHWTKCGQTCCWANARCGLMSDLDRKGRFISSDKTRIPTHKSMEKARYETFFTGKGWNHDKIPNHGANSKMMARAGFIYTPQHNGDDLATCFYCNTSLSGWDAEDDPLEEHRKREDKMGFPCPFFSASPSEIAPSTKPVSRAQSTKPSSKSQAKPPSRSVSRSKHQDIVQPTKTFDGELDEESDAPLINTTHSTVKTPRKGRTTSSSSARKLSAKTPGNKIRSSSRSGLRHVAEDDEDETEAPLESQPPVEKKVRSRSKSVARSKTVDQPEPDDEEPVTRKPSRSRTKKVVSEAEEEDVPRKSSRSKSKTTTTTEDEVPRKQSRAKSKSKAVESEQEEIPQITAKPKHKRAVSRSKSKAPVETFDLESEREPEPEILTVAPKKKTPVKSKLLPVPAAQDLFDDDVFTDHYVPPPVSPPPDPKGTTTMELPPLYIPKRNPAKKAPMVEDVTETLPVDNEKKTGRPKNKPPPPSRSRQSENEGLETEPPSLAESYKPLAPVSTNPSLPPSSKEKPVGKVKSHNHKMKVVEISSDEEPEEKEAHSIPQQDKENSRTISKAQLIAAPTSQTQITQSAPPSKLTTTQVKREKKQVVVETIQPIPTPSPIPPSPHINPDVSMECVEPEDNVMQNIPVTPPRPTLQTLPPDEDVQRPVTPETNPVSAEPPFLPALSKLPFTALHALTEPELDMTVEEWIRYQMDVEFDKFRRDGERELQRFRKRAEEVRKVIEGL